MTFTEAQEALSKARCPDCYGLGSQNDCEPGDLSFRTWKCPPCKGTGWKDGEPLMGLVG